MSHSDYKNISEGYLDNTKTQRVERYIINESDYEKVRRYKNYPETLPFCGTLGEIVINDYTPPLICEDLFDDGNGTFNTTYRYLWNTDKNTNKKYGYMDQVNAVCRPPIVNGITPLLGGQGYDISWDENYITYVQQPCQMNQPVPTPNVSRITETTTAKPTTTTAKPTTTTAKPTTTTAKPTTTTAKPTTTTAKPTTTTAKPTTTTAKPNEVCGVGDVPCLCPVGTDGKTNSVYSGCDICSIPLTKTEHTTKKGTYIGKNKFLQNGIAATDSITKDYYTNQVCKFSESTNNFGWSQRTCQGKHLCDNKYIYNTTDVDGLTLSTINNIDDLNTCYAHISTDKRAVGIVYDKVSKNCFLIDKIPNMDPAKLSVTWAYQKTQKKPYYNDNTILILKK